MSLSQVRKIRLNPLAVSFCIPFVGMLFVMLISGYEPFGTYSMLYSDMYHQYYPFFVEFRRALRSGDGLMYTWSVGMGMDYLGLIAYYLASPLNLLSVLVPEDWLLEFFSLLVPVKLGLAGLSFDYMLCRLFKRKELSVALFGGFYGLCAWALGFQWNIMWLDTFALLPLVVLGTVALLKEKRFALYTLSLFLSVFCNYYIGFFTCIFVFLIFFCYQFCHWRGWRRFMGDFVRIGVFSVLAIGMTAILTLPALSALGDTQSSVNSFPTGFRLNIADSHTLLGLLDAMRQVAGNMGGAIEPNFKEGLPNVYCGIGSVVLMFLYLTAKRIYRREKLCTAALLLFFNVSFIIRQLDYIWHGMHFTNMIPYRFSFLYSFVVLYMAYRAWLLRRSFSTLQLWIAGVLAGAVLLLSEEVSERIPLTLGGWELDIPVYVIYNLFFLVMYLISLLYGTVRVPIPADADREEAGRLMQEQKKIRGVSAALLAVVMCSELIGNLICFGLYFTGTGVSNYPQGTEAAESVIRYMHEREKGNLFFRAETTHSQTLNDGALNGYRGISAFTSSANVKNTLFLQSLGFSAKNTYNRYLYEESSPVADLFLGIKYRINRDGKNRESSHYRSVNTFKDVSLLENTFYLPLGFLAQRELAQVEFDTAQNAFVFQNELFSAATGLSEDVWHRISGDALSISANGVTVTEQNDTGYCRYSADMSNTEVIYSFTANRDGYACIHLNLPKRNSYYVSVNGVELYRETVSLPQMIAVGDVCAGDVIGVRIVCTAGESSTMTVNAAVLDEALFSRGYETLNASTWELTDFESTRVAGTVSCDRDGLLYTSVPQNGNWIAILDGQEVPVTLVGDCMICIPIRQGEHTVELVYRNQAFSLGWKVSLGCLLIFAALVQFGYRPDWKKLLPPWEKGKYER